MNPFKELVLRVCLALSDRIAVDDNAAGLLVPCMFEECRGPIFEFFRDYLDEFTYTESYDYEVEEKTGRSDPKLSQSLDKCAHGTRVYQYIAFKRREGDTFLTLRGYNKHGIRTF